MRPWTGSGIGSDAGGDKASALLTKLVTYPFVFRFDGEGRVLETLQASASSGLPSFSSVVQSGDELLLGSPGGVGEIDADRVYRVRLLLR